MITVKMFEQHAGQFLQVKRVFVCHRLCLCSLFNAVLMFENRENVNTNPLNIPINMECTDL